MTDPSTRALFVFLLVTGVLGGVAAVAAGRAVARTWRPLWQLAVYVGLLMIAVRLLSAALFGAPLLCGLCAVLDALVLAVAGGAAYRIARARQLQVQYPWAFGVGARPQKDA